MSQDSLPQIPRIVIVGGGFTGACLAIHLVRGAARAVHVTIVEPKAEIGRGLAYGTADPDHRLNAPAYAHSILPEDFWHFVRWTEDTHLLLRDPHALRPDGGAYFRRNDFGSYIGETLRAHVSWRATGSRIEHLKDSATGAVPAAAGFTVYTERSGPLAADVLAVATGNPLPRLPSPLSRDWAANPAVIENPFEPGRLQRIAGDARVFVIGSGLTALDALSTLLVQGHRGPITVVSRRGLRPRSQGPVPPPFAQRRDDTTAPPLPPGAFLAKVLGPTPDFLGAGPGRDPTVTGWLKALRARIAAAESAGGSWHQPFDDLRDTVWQLWPKLPTGQQRRFIARLRPWYDVHRFRSPPQNEELVAAAASKGLVRYKSAHVLGLDEAGLSGGIAVTIKAARDRSEQRIPADAIVNCSGLDAVAGAASNPFLRSLDADGLFQRDASSLGFKVDAECRAIGADGHAIDALRVAGPPTLSTFGDTIGAFFIGVQVHRIVPSMLRAAGVWR